MRVSAVSVLKSGIFSLGEIDLEIIKVLHEKHPTAKVDNEVVEPSKEMLNKYKSKNEH